MSEIQAMPVYDLEAIIDRNLIHLSPAGNVVFQTCIQTDYPNIDLEHLLALVEDHTVESNVTFQPKHTECPACDCRPDDYQQFVIKWESLFRVFQVNRCRRDGRKGRADAVARSG